MIPLEHEYKVMGLAAYVAEQKMLNDKVRMFQNLLNLIRKNLWFGNAKRHTSNGCSNKDDRKNAFKTTF